MPSSVQHRQRHSTQDCKNKDPQRVRDINDAAELPYGMIVRNDRASVHLDTSRSPHAATRSRWCGRTNGPHRRVSPSRRGAAGALGDAETDASPTDARAPRPLSRLRIARPRCVQQTTLRDCLTNSFGPAASLAASPPELKCPQQSQTRILCEFVPERRAARPRAGEARWVGALCCQRGCAPRTFCGTPRAARGRTHFRCRPVNPSVSRRRCAPRRLAAPQRASRPSPPATAPSRRAGS